MNRKKYNEMSIALFCSVAALTLFSQRYRKIRKDEKLSSQSSFRVSSPGKVLVAGGYLVLEAPNVGVSISTTSRLYVTVDLTSESINDLVQRELSCQSIEENSFVETCLRETMTYALRKGTLKRNLVITIEADNDFYSFSKYLIKQNKPLTSTSLLDLPRCAIPDELEVSKTGLGSSAALTTSLVSALLISFNIIQPGRQLEDEQRRVVHNLSQIIHCKAQGKVGSGFDVATAIYGTIAYSRFSKSILDRCFEGPSIREDLLDQLVNHFQWDQKVAPFQLPSGLDIMLGDVSGGSSSASMAKKVLSWKETNPTVAGPLWTQLGKVNSQIHEVFEDLTKISELEKDLYRETLAHLEKLNFVEWSRVKSNVVVTKLIALRELFQDARSLLKYIGELSTVEIEPDSQTSLLDATLVIPGVLAAGIPGAGGHDAVFVFILSKEARSNVERLWSSWHSYGNNYVCPLTLCAGSTNDFGVLVERL